MRNRIYYLIGLLLLCLGVAAYGQNQITNRTMTGNEVIVAAQGGPGGPSIFVTTGQLRNGMNMTTTATTSGTIAVTAAQSGLVSTAASVSLTVDLPPQPFDGQTFEWVNGSGGAFTAGTVATTDGSTIVNGTAMGTAGAGTSKEWRYVLSTNSWYAMR